MTYYMSSTRRDSMETRDGIVASGMEEGARESMDLLDALLGTLARQ